MKKILPLLALAALVGCAHDHVVHRHHHFADIVYGMDGTVYSRQMIASAYVYHTCYVPSVTNSTVYVPYRVPTSYVGTLRPSGGSISVPSSPPTKTAEPLVKETPEAPEKTGNAGTTAGAGGGYVTSQSGTSPRSNAETQGSFTPDPNAVGSFGRTGQFGALPPNARWEETPKDAVPEEVVESHEDVEVDDYGTPSENVVTDEEEKAIETEDEQTPATDEGKEEPPATEGESHESSSTGGESGGSSESGSSSSDSSSSSSSESGSSGGESGGGSSD